MRRNSIVWKLGIVLITVIVVVIDTLRKDHLSLYGYAKPTSPGLEALAREFDSLDILGASNDVDGNGMVVSLTTTLNDLYGSRLWVPEVGIFLNDEMDDFAIFHDHDAVGHTHGFRLIVGDEDKGDGQLSLQGLEFFLHLLPQAQIQCSKRFVE